MLKESVIDRLVERYALSDAQREAGNYRKSIFVCMDSIFRLRRARASVASRVANNAMRLWLHQKNNGTRWRSC